MDYTNKQMICDLWEFIRPYKKRFWLGVFLRATNDLLWIINPLIYSAAITFVAKYHAGDSITLLLQLGGAALVVGVYHHVARDVSKYCIYPIAEKTAIDAHLKTLQHMYRLDSSWHEGENSGNKMKRIQNGNEAFNKIIRVIVDLLIESTINVVVISIVFLNLDWRLNLLFVFFFITYYLLSQKLIKRAIKQSREVNIEQEDFEGLSFETLNNISTIKSLGIAKNVMPYLFNKSVTLFQKTKLRVKYNRVRDGTLNTYQEIFRIIMVSFTIWQVLLGNFEIGTIALTLMYFAKIESSANEFSQVSQEFVSGKISLQRLKDILDVKPEVEDSGTKVFKRNWKKLTLKDVTFSYHGKAVLKDLSFEVKRGEKIGIVGISGTGKSTLFKLLLKLYHPTQGDVLFDSTDLRDIDRQTFMPHVAVVPQETELFNLSLKDNVVIAGGKKLTKKHEEELFQKAIKTAHVKEFVNKLPFGVESLIGEKGIKLSGGERQRVGIARAIYKQPDILLMDEATSHLDSASEEKIQIALEEFFKGVTAIVIAHRLSTIKKMDRIFVMHKGAVVESGTLKQLMARKGEFWKLWKKQS